MDNQLKYVFQSADMTLEQFEEFLAADPVHDADAMILAELDKIRAPLDSDEHDTSHDLSGAGHLGPIGPIDEDVDGRDNSAVSGSVSDPMSVVSTRQEMSMPLGFASFPDGIYELSTDDTADPIFVCSPLRVDAVFADRNGRGCGRLVCVKASNGQWHEIPLTNAELQRRPGEVIANLVDYGLELGYDKKAKDRLLLLLKRWKPTTALQTVDRMGWVDDTHESFVLGSSLIGRQNVLPLSQSTGIATGLVAVGDADGWRREVGMKCRGNPLMILATSLAFSGPLLAPLGRMSGGLHFRGASSSGKTTLLNLAASVWGGRQLISQWRATSNGLEAIASTLNDMLLPLDEIAEISAAELSNAIYMLANGTGKARMNMNAILADQAHWRLALISSGEISVEEKLKEARLDVKTGHEVRLIDVEADSQAYGAFDILHGAVNAAAFAETIQQVASKHHGAVGREFVKQLIEKKTFARTEILDRLVRGHVANWLAKLPGVADGPTSRVATRFAVIGTAGAIATKFGLTGWSEGEATAAAEQAFLDWYDRRYGAKREAVESYVKPLQDFLAANMNSLPDLSGPHLAGVQPIAWSDAQRAYLPKMTWESVFSNLDATKAAKALLDMDMLLPGEEGRFARKAPRSIEGRPRLYTVNVERVMSFKAG